MLYDLGIFNRIMGWRFAEYDEMVNFQPSASGKVNHLRGEATIWLGFRLCVQIKTNYFKKSLPNG